MKIKRFLAAAGIRAARTVAQGAIAAIGAATAFGEVNWPCVLSSAGLAGVLSLLTSVITGLPEVDGGMK